MILSQSTDHSPSLDQHIFCPFPVVDPTDVNHTHTYHSFENIKTNCKYYSLPAPGTSSLSKPSADSNPGKFTIIHINARSLLSDDKFAEFEVLLFRTKCRWSIICVSETWLCKEMEEKRHIDGYSGYFDSRIDGAGGGVAIYVNNDVVRETKQLPKMFSCTESLLIECQLRNNLTILVCQIYKPPNLSNNNFIVELGNAIETIQIRKKVAFICGDFNLDLFSISKGGAALDFFNILASSGYLPLISKSTRIQNTCYSLIDNIFCNNLTFVNTSGIILDDTGDHFPIFTTLDFTVNPKGSKREIQRQFDYHKIPELTEHISKSLENFEYITDPETAGDIIITAYTSGIDKFSFQYSPNRKKTPIKPWVSPSILAAIDNRCKLFNIKQKNPSQANINKYVKYRNVLNTLIRGAKHKYIQDELETNKDNAKQMWKILITHTTGKSCQNTYPNYFKNNEDKLVEDNLEIAEDFNAFFSSVGKNLQQNMKGCPEEALKFLGDPCKNTINHLQPTNTNELISIIKNMKNVGHGVDKINARIFKLTFEAIIDKLVHFINICLDQGKFPSRLKIAVIKPIYKSGDRTHITNYRPISILPYISKIVEKVIHIRIMEHVSKNNIICPNQFGFRKGFSTYMPLLILQDKVNRGFESNKINCGIYLDLKKAFDTVDHRILLLKLHSYGITDTFLAIIDSYLSNRYQCVEHTKVKSSLRQINIGVPQGSILGPLLFILYINDFPKISTKFTSLLYADDTALIFEADSTSELQSDLDTELPKVYEWLQANKLSLNTNKTFYQVYNKSKVNVDINVILNGINIKHTETVRYLGVYIDEELKWQSHIMHISNIISRNIGIISRSRYFLGQKHRFLLYNSLVLPYLNYCCLVWGNATQSLLNKLLILQKKIIRIIDNQPRLAHSNPIYIKLKILKVKDIARHQAIVVLYNVATGNAPPAIASLFEFTQTNQRASRVSRHFEEIFTRKVYRTRTIAWIGPRLWNSIVAPRFPRINSIPYTKKQIKEIAKNHMICEYE